MDSAMFAAGLTSLAFGGGMTLFGWNVIRQNRRREAARTALLSRMAFPGGGPGDAAIDPPTEPGGSRRIDEFRSDPSVATGTLFREPEISRAASRRTVAVAAVCIVWAIVAGSYWWFAGVDTSATPESASVASATTVSVPPPVKVPAAPRVELVSLSHRFTPAAFLVTGRVRNPTGGAPLHGVVAMVHLVDSAGRVFMTVRAPITRRVWDAGEVSEFSASAARATNVARYRVEFTDNASAVIPHFDLRHVAANSP